MNWAKTETKVSNSMHEEWRWKSNLSYEANERQRMHQRAPAFHGSLVSFYLFIFTCKYISSYTSVDLFTTVLISLISYHF